MAGYIVCICTSGVTAAGNNKAIVALNGVNGAQPLEGVGPTPDLYDHHSIAQEAAGAANLNRPYTNAEWTSGVLKYQGNSVGYTNQWDINLPANRTLLGGAFVNANTPIDFGAFQNGVYQLFSYAVSPGTTVNEGVTVTFNSLNTRAIPGGKTIYWTVENVTGAAANISPTSGSAVVTAPNISGNWPGTFPDFSITTTLDNTTEGGGSYQVYLRQGGTSGRVFATMGPISVNDSSKYPYINNTPASLNEGTAYTFNVTAYDIPGSATYYWSIDSDTARFSGATNGSFTISNNAGSFTVNPIANLFTDGATNATISLRTGSVTGGIMESKVIPINDLSQTPAFTSPTSAASVNEGTAQSFSVSGFTNGAAYAATWYWYINHGTTVAADFSGSVDSGTFTMNNGGNFSITPIADTLSDGVISGNRISARNETFTVSIARTNLGTAVATSPTITIRDTSLSPAANITWTLTGGTGLLTLNLCTPVSASRWTVTGGPYAVGVSGNTLNVVVPSGVWISGGLLLSGGVGGDILNVKVDGTITGLGGAGWTRFNYQTNATAQPGGYALSLAQVGVGISSIALSGSGTLAGGGGAGGGGYTVRVYSGTGAGGYPSITGNTCGSPTLAQQSPPIICGFSSNYGQSNPATGNIQMSAVIAGNGGTKLTGGLIGYGAFVSIAGNTNHSGLGGGGGGGGGATYAAVVSPCGRVKGGNGGTGTSPGGDGTGAASSIPIAAGGGGGGWGAAGGRGNCLFFCRFGTAGSGGLALKTGGKTVSGSVATQYGATAA